MKNTAKRIVTNSFKITVFLFVFILAKSVGPGSFVYFGADGNAISNVDSALVFDSIQLAYQAQLNLGDGWEIVTE